MRDVRFAAGNFLWEDVPQDKEFYGHYFRSDLERKFLSYYILFSEMYEEGFERFYHNFMDHTGHRCTKRWVQKLMRRYRTLERALQTAYRNDDLVTIAEIRSGQSKIR